MLGDHAIQPMVVQAALVQPAAATRQRRARRDTVEVRVLWGGDVLALRHLRAPYSFFVGESQAGVDPSDFEVAGLADKPRSLVELRDGEPWAVLLPEAKITAQVAGHEPLDVEKAASRGLVEVQDGAAGAQRIALQPGVTVQTALGALTFQVRRVAASRKLVGGLLQEPRRKAIATWLALSVVVHLGWVGALASWLPPLGASADDQVSTEQHIFMLQHLEAGAERELEPVDVSQITAEVVLVEGGTGNRSKGEEGVMGSPVSSNRGHHYAVRGPADRVDPKLARQEALRDAGEFGIVGLLYAGTGGDPEAPTAWFGGVDALGQDPLSARGTMWGDVLGATHGTGGLGLSGVGEGGGGRGEGIGLGSIGTVGQGSGTGIGQGFGAGDRSRRPPRVWVGGTSVSGRLPPEAVQRIVRQHFGRFRLCYEQGLRHNPTLAGRVKVRFVIGRDGTVSNVGGSGDLPDPGVVACVTRAFYGLTFPQPEGGVVTVVYPIVLSPTG